MPLQDGAVISNTNLKTKETEWSFSKWFCKEVNKLIIRGDMSNRKSASEHLFIDKKVIINNVFHPRNMRLA